MSYIILGTDDDLIIKVPGIGITDWGTTLKTDTFQKIADHDHTGSGNGNKITLAAMEADAVDGTILRLDNDQYIRARNAAGTADANLIKLNTNDKIEVATAILLGTIEPSNSAITLTDNTSVAITAGVISLGADEACKVEYKIVRNGAVEKGTLEFTDVDTVPSQTWTGIDNGVTFTVNSGDLEYTTTSTGSNATLTYIIIKG